MKLEIKEILEDGNNFEEMYCDIIDFIEDIELNNKFEKLNKGERSVYLLEKFVSEVNDGGFDQYIDETDGVFINETLEYLEASGNGFLADLLKSARDVYETGDNDDIIADRLNDLNEEFYTKMDNDQYYKSVIDYIKLNAVLF